MEKPKDNAKRKNVISIILCIIAIIGLLTAIGSLFYAIFKYDPYMALALAGMAAFILSMIGANINES